MALWVAILVIVLVILLIAALVFTVVFYVLHYWRFKNIPHETPQPLPELISTIRQHVGFTEHEIDQQHYGELYAQFKEKGTPFCGFYHMLQPRVLILSRKLVQHILVKNFSNFNSRGIYYNCSDDPLSGELWNRSGSKWREMRIRLEPLFRKEHMRNLFECIHDESDCLLKEIEQRLSEQQPAQQPLPQAQAVSVDQKQEQRESLMKPAIDIRRLAKHYVLSILATSVFGLDGPREREKYPLEEFEMMTELALHTRRHDVFINAMLTRFYKLGRKLHFSTTNLKVHDYFMRLINDVVQQREKHYSLSDQPKKDLLQVFIDLKRQEYATHDTEDLDEKQLKEHLDHELAAHLFSVLKTGYEPTYKALAYALYELALNEWAQKRVREEVLEAMAQHNDELNFDAIQKLKFLGQVLSETVRLHPIQPYLIRRTLNDYRVPEDDHYVIPKDMFVIIPIHAMHNDPSIYFEPEQFKPERFCGVENRKREQAMWLGFGEGPRSCLGLQFAQLLLRVAIARLLLKYRLSVSPERVISQCHAAIHLELEPLDPADSIQIETGLEADAGD